MVITLIMVSVIQKLSPHFSLAKWILCSTGLSRYLHPTDDELRKLSGVPREKAKSKKDKQRNGHVDQGKSSTFHIPRSLDIQLETVGISPYDIVHLRYYTEYQWLVDFSLYASIVYVVSEVGSCAILFELHDNYGIPFAFRCTSSFSRSRKNSISACCGACLLCSLHCILLNTIFSGLNEFTQCILCSLAFGDFQ